MKRRQLAAQGASEDAGAVRRAGDGERVGDDRWRRRWLEAHGPRHRLRQGRLAAANQGWLLGGASATVRRPEAVRVEDEADGGSRHAPAAR